MKLKHLIFDCRSHIALHIESSYHPCLVKQIGFNCKYCHHSFWVIEKLNEHMFNRHPEKFEHNFLMCSICGATFINKVSSCLTRSTRRFCQHKYLFLFSRHAFDNIEISNIQRAIDSHHFCISAKYAAQRTLI